MITINRQVHDFIIKDVIKKMVFISGPRQCGKTHLTKQILQELGAGAYYNWDILKDRPIIKHQQFSPLISTIALDEFHKFPAWRNWLKGFYDQWAGQKNVMVTGSARLDVYSHGGDSLQGRYVRYRLHPLTLTEICHPLGKSFSPEEFFKMPKDTPCQKVLQQLLDFGGFPEPFLSGSLDEAKKWRLLYGERLVEEDIRDLENIKNLQKLLRLLERLGDSVGSLLSLNSLREDLEVAHDTLTHWMVVLENLYALFRVPPFGPSLLKSLKKANKMYFWDWGRANTGRFENLVACHLFRLVHWMEDRYGQRCELRFFHTTTHEVDFIVLKEGQPWMAIECKEKDKPLSPGLRYLLERVSFPYAFQISCYGTQFFQQTVGQTPVTCVPADRFLLNLV